MDYRIVDVDESNRDRYCVCLEEWSDEMKEAGDRKCRWYETMKNRGLGVKLVEDEDGTLSGLIQYVPAEYAPLTDGNYYFIYCIWVHGHKKGIGDRRGRGMGQALLQAAEEDIRLRGAGGIAAWGLSLPFWMKASWYRKQGYRTVQKEGISRLLWKPLKEDAEPPRWYSHRKLGLNPAGGTVTVTSVVNGICPVSNLANVRAASVASEWGPEVIFREIDSSDPDVLREWGSDNSLYINNREIPLGPPLDRKKIRRAIARELKIAGRK